MALVAAPCLLLQAASNGLAVDIETPSDRGDRQAFFVVQPVNLLPAVFLDHELLLEGQSLELHGPTLTNRIPFHRAPPLRAGGDFSRTTTGEYCMADDIIRGAGAAPRRHPESAPTFRSCSQRSMC